LTIFPCFSKLFAVYPSARKVFVLMPYVIHLSDILLSTKSLEKNQIALDTALVLGPFGKTQIACMKACHLFCTKQGNVVCALWDSDIQDHRWSLDSGKYMI
jgi:hypothetical protein